MTHVHSMDIFRVRDGSAWWSVAIVIALHALLLFWLMSVHWAIPLKPFAAAMVLVELRSTPETAVANAQHGAVSTKKTPSPTIGHAASAAASQHRDLTPRDFENRIITPQATATPGSALADQPPSSPLAGQAPSGLGVSHGADAPAAGGDGARARGRFHAPEVVRRWRPDYPLDAFQARQQGRVDVMVTIGADASVIEAHVYQSSGNASLDSAAVEAVRHYTFRSARRDRDPVEAQALVTIDWEILTSGSS